ncbi:MAG: S8 family peptidase [Candidatus Acetothermia bacterium]
MKVPGTGRKGWAKAGKILAVLLVLLLTFAVKPAVLQIGGVGGFQTTTTDDSSYRWGLSSIEAPKAWEVTRGSEKITVAVIDSGIDRSIPHLQENLWVNEEEIPGDGIDNDGNGYVDDVHGWDFRDDKPRPPAGKDLHYHGTFVSSLIASIVDDDTGAGGVAPKVRIMDLRFLNSSGQFTTSDWNKLVKSIDYAVDNGARIINLSVYSSATPPDFVREAFQRAEREGVLIIGIAGNENSKVGHFGKWPEVLAVGALNRGDSAASFSNHGPEVELSAPGAGVLSLTPGGKTSTGSGTSFAAPHVAGTAALLLSLHPDLTNDQLKEVLLSSTEEVEDPGPTNRTGQGKVNAQKAIQNLQHLNE